MERKHLLWVLLLFYIMYVQSGAPVEAASSSDVLVSEEGKVISNVNLVLSDLDTSGHYYYRGVDLAIFESADGSSFTAMGGKVKRMMTKNTQIQVELGAAAGYDESKTYKIGYRVLYSPIGVDATQIIVADRNNGKDGWNLAKDGNNRDISFAVGTPPLPPVTVTAVTGVGQITLQWDTVTEATYYNIYQGTEPDINNATEIASVTGATYTVTGLANGTTYYFAVKASNAAGRSSFSNVVSATPLAALPSELTSVSLASSNQNSIFAKSGDQVKLTFTANEALNGLPAVTIAGRTVSATDTGANRYLAEYTFTGDEQEGDVPFTIDFADASGNIGAVSSTTDGSRVLFDKTAPTAPNYEIISPSGYESGDIVIGDITFNITNGTDHGGSGVWNSQYRTRWNGGAWGAWKEYTSAVTLSTPGTTDIEMRTVDTAGNESGATIAQVVIGELAAPSEPALMPAIAGDGQVTLFWNTVAGATDYYIYQGTEPDIFRATEIATVTGATYTATGLMNGTTYYFAVKAGNAAGDSSFSNVVSVTPRAELTAALTSVSLLSNNSAPDLATTGDQAILTFSANKALNGLPTVTIAGGSASVADMGGNLYKAAYTFTGNEPEGNVGFTIDFADASGNAGATVTSTTDGSRVIFDKTAPSGTLLMNNGAATTRSLAVTLSITSHDGGGSGNVQMRLSNDNRSWSSWEAASATKGWSLSAGTGTKTVYMQLKDAAGNVTTQPMVASIRVLASESANPGRGSTPTSSDAAPPAAQITLRAGEGGEVALEDAVVISIPAQAASREMRISIEKVADTASLMTNQVNPVSPVYELLKSISENFNIPVTLTFVFDPSRLGNNQRAAVFYFDEVKQEWVEVAGGRVSGNSITVEVDHFTKFAVFAVKREEQETVPETEVAFHDIAGHWAEARIKQAVNYGIVTGFPDGTFKPNRTVTRAEFVVMLTKTLKSEGDGEQLAFTDTEKVGAWARLAIAQAVEAGIISGYEDGSFRPDQGITRAEMAVMIAGALGISPNPEAVTGFADEKEIPSWARGAAAGLKRLSMIDGRGINDFDPGSLTTRAEAVKVLLQMSEELQ